MKTDIFYFSATGNSFIVAKNISDNIENSSIIPIAKVINNEIDFSADVIGIVYPVYMLGLPLIVRDFVKKICSDSKKYIFSVATCGGFAGNANNQIKKILNSNNLILSSGFVVDMPGNYTPLYGAIDTEKQNKLFKEKDEKIKYILNIVKDQKSHKIENQCIFMQIIGSILYAISSKKILTMDKNFWINEKCNSCGTCEKICPVNNIEMIDGKPKWKNNCQHCMACLQWCPVQAIQYKKNTVSRKRYTNPMVKLNDLIID